MSGEFRFRSLIVATVVLMPETLRNSSRRISASGFSSSFKTTMRDASPMCTLPVATSTDFGHGRKFNCELAGVTSAAWMNADAQIKTCRKRTRICPVMLKRV